MAKETTFPKTHRDWPGQPRCQASIPYGWQSYQCDRRACRDNDTHCGVHSNAAVAKREAKKEERSRQQERQWSREYHRQNAIRSIVAAAEVEAAKPKNEGQEYITITIARRIIVDATANTKGK